MEIEFLNELEYDSKLFYKLARLTHLNGDLQQLFECNPKYSFVQGFLIRGERTIKGWSCIYKASYSYSYPYRIGVYVKKHYRHKGLGNKLLDKAIRFCEKDNLSYCWFDRNENIWRYESCR